MMFQCFFCDAPREVVFVICIFSCRNPTPLKNSTTPSAFWWQSPCTESEGRSQCCNGAVCLDNWSSNRAYCTKVTKYFKLGFWSLGAIDIYFSKCGSEVVSCLGNIELGVVAVRYHSNRPLVSEIQHDIKNRVEHMKSTPIRQSLMSQLPHKFWNERALKRNKQIKFKWKIWPSPPLDAVVFVNPTHLRAKKLGIFSFLFLLVMFTLL